MDVLQRIIDGFIDFEGQKLADYMTTGMLVVFGIVSFAIGFITQDLSWTVKLGLGGTLLTFLVVVPPWPVYNKHPVAWLPAGTTGEEQVEKKER